MLSESRVFFSANKPATSHCFNLANRSLRAAEIQINRIWDRPVVTGSTEIVIAEHQDIIIDIHFYFIALRNLYRFLAMIVNDSAFEQFKPDLENLDKIWFCHYQKARDTLEHIDERLPGEKKEDRIIEVSDVESSRKIQYGVSLSRGIFKHSNQEWDISRETFLKLKEDVEILLTKVVSSCSY